MPAQSLLEKSKYVQSIAPAQYGAGTDNGAAVAVADFRKAEFILDVGTMASGATLDVHVEYSTDDGSTWSDLLGDDDVTQVTFAQITDTDDNVVRRGLVYVTECPLNTTHLRAVGVTAGGNADYGVGVRLGEPYSAPVVKDSTAQASGGNAFYAIHGVGAR